MISHVKSMLEHSGWYEMANAELAAGYFKDLKRVWPKLRLISNVGAFGVSEIFFLPRARRTIRARFRAQLGEALAHADRMRTAITTIDLND